MEKAYKYRIYPNKRQQELIQKTFGCTRFVYNYYLSKRREVYENESRTMGFYECCKDLTKLKTEYEWLKEPDKCALQNCLKDLNAAYQNFFRDKSFGYPKFKSKKTHRFSYRSNCSYTGKRVPTIEFNKAYIKLPKLGWVKTKDKQVPQGRILNATISQEPSGKYYVSLCCTDVDIAPLPKTNKQIGIDLGIKDLCITSEGVKYSNPSYLVNSYAKLKKLQKGLDRKTSFGSNWEKNRIKLARAYEKVCNQRNDYIHKLTKKLVNDNDVICVETLDVSRIIGESILSNWNSDYRVKVSDVSWKQIIQQLEYKTNWYGKKIKRVDTYYPSSQICHICGHKNPQVKDLSVREWTCLECGATHDRDVNAAINILNAAV